MADRKPALILVLFAWLLPWNLTANRAESRPADWAVAPDHPIPGLPNFFKVTDKLYRGAQPTIGGMRKLKGMGIKTVLSLRAFDDDDSLLPGITLDHERIRLKTWHPEDEDVVRFLKIVTDPARAPVFVHCQHGADRTGMMMAIYRIAVQGWSKENAIREMVDGGYGFYPGWINLKRYVRKLDIDAIKRKAGLSPRG